MTISHPLPELKTLRLVLPAHHGRHAVVEVSRELGRLLLDLLRQLASRRHHQRVRPLVATSSVIAGRSMMYANIGTTNAHVFPDPVSAMPMTSRFSRPMGMDAI